jgi:hypothetical protein
MALAKSLAHKRSQRRQQCRTRFRKIRHFPPRQNNSINRRQTLGRVIASSPVAPAPAPQGSVGEPPVPANMPKIVHPSARQVYSDASGNPRAFGPGSTKLGSLMTVSAFCGKAARQDLGKRTVGEGFQAARAIPMQNEQLAQEKMQTQMGQQQMEQANTPVSTPMGVMPMWKAKQVLAAQQANAELANKQADTKLKGAQADKAEQDKAAPNDKVLHAYVGADGKQHLVMQKPDNSTYDAKMGDVNQKDATGIDAAALEAMRVQNGGNPPTLQQILGYKKAGAQATHIVNQAQQVPADDMNTIVQGLVDGTLDVKGVFSRLAAPQRIQAIAAAKRIDPNFSMATFPTRQQANNYFLNGKGADQIQSFNTFLGHAKDLSDIVDQYRMPGGDVSPLINKPLNWIRKNAGSTDYSTLMAGLQPVRDEFMTFLQNNHAMTDMDRKAGDVILSENATPAQIQAAIKQISHTAAIRLGENNNRYRRVFGKDYPDMLPADNEKYLRDIGALDTVFKDKVRGAGSPQAPTASAPSADGGWKVVNGIRVKQ